MPLKRYLFLMGLATLICWLSLLTVVFCIDPTLTSTIGFMCFYFSLFFSLLGTFSLLGLIIRLAVKKHEIPYKNIGVSLRQALWFSILVTLSMLLLGQKMFAWWSLGLLICGLVVLETFFLSINSNNK